MKIFEKINRFYTELKRFNDNIERLTAFDLQNPSKSAAEIKSRQPIDLPEYPVPSGKITSEQGCRIKYWLHRSKITQETVAEHAGCSPVMVAQFLKGTKSSKKIKLALLKLLGYKDFDDLVAPFHEGGVA